ncbi:serine/threonine-protein kinase [Nocardia sp. NPDC051750]|uniref:serine/threonine-protein kinase n=1 Tax=Nocardia sp. NPDC051750 TaxID=3364325 RepID=UPI0037AED43D
MLQAGDEFEDFIIVKVLGAGGMGVVYLARHPRLESLVALKVLNEALAADPKARDAFEREAGLASGLDHPNIVPVHDRSKRGNPRLWLSMRYIRGGDANALLAGSPRGLPAEQALQLIVDAAAALDYAHEEGVLHRDVKPANLLIEYDARHERRALLTDFGIARTLGDTVTVSGVNGTVAYTAPERFLLQCADHRADIYSLGCTLFQLLTGRLPFPPEEFANVIGAHISEPAPSLRRFRPDLPAALDTVIATAMTKDPSTRYGSCHELATAASSAIAGATVAAAGAATSEDAPTEVVRAAAASSAPVVPDISGPDSPRSSVRKRASGWLPRRPVTAGLVVGSVLAVGLGAAFLAPQVMGADPAGTSGAATDVAATVTPPAAGPSVVATVPVGLSPGGVAVDFASHTAYIANFGDNTVSAIDITTDTVTATVPVGLSPHGVAVDPGNRTAYVVNYGDDTVSVIDIATNAVSAVVPVGDSPGSVAVDPGTHTAYVVNFGDRTVSVIDTLSGSVTGTVPVGDTPQGVAVDPITRTVYVVNLRDGTMSVIDGATRSVTATVAVGRFPNGVAVDLGTRTAYVVNYGDRALSVIDLAAGTVTATVSVGTNPHAVAVDWNTRTAYVTNMGDDTVSVIDLATNTVTATVPVGDRPGGLYLEPGTRAAYVTNFGDSTVSVLAL